jgi:hypothetical protein
MVLTMGRIRNDIPVSAAANRGRTISVAGEGALMGVIIIIEGNRRAP